MPRQLDHLVVPVRDLPASAGTLEAAGYVVTPRADHPFGTSNQLVVFVDTYIELVAVSRPDLIPAEGFARDVAEFLATGEGVSHVAVATGDAAADNALLAAAGLSIGPVFDFSRPAPRIDGATATAAFTLAMSAASPSIGAFFCQHHVPEAVWYPPHLKHPNGARELVEIMLDGVAPQALRATCRLDGVHFSSGQSRISTDGHHEPVWLGSLMITGFAAPSHT